MSKEERKKIHIRGGEVFTSESSSFAYRVEEGQVLVYLIPFYEEGPGRRMFLAEMPAGLVIPGFFATDAKKISWRFGFVALEEALLEECDLKGDSEIVKIREDFIKKSGLPIKDSREFEGELIELYGLNAVREEGNIYKIREEREDTKERSLRLIRSLFLKNDEIGEADFLSTGDALYDCAARLCLREKIRIAPREKVIRSAGKSFTVADIARVSHFTIRRIVLQDRWYKKDGGAFLAFDVETDEPCCVFMSATGRYLACRAGSETVFKVGSEFAGRLKPEAIMFYRPFPDEKINLLSLIAFGMNRVCPSDIIRIVTLSIIGVLTGLLVPRLNELVFDRFIPLGDLEALVQIGLVILSCALGNITFTVVKNLSTFRAMNSMEYAVLSAVIDRLFSLPESFFRKYEAAELGIRAMNVSRIYNVFSESILNSLLSALFSLIYIFRMMAYSAPLTGRALLLLTAVLFFVVLTGLRQLKYEKEKLELDQKTDSVMFQYVEGMEKLRTTGSEGRACLNYLKGLTGSRRINLKKERLAVITVTVSEAFQIIFSIAFYFMMVQNDLKLTIGCFMGFITAFGALQSALFEVAQNFLVVNRIQPMYEMARPILETLPESGRDAAVPGEMNGEIELNNVTFSYDPEAGEPVIKNLNLDIKSGEYVGIVGESGSGKSTLLKLLMGFERPQVGGIYYDGHDIDELDKRELRKRFGVVLQSGGLISGSIYENIVITSPGCLRERVEEVIREVGLEKDIEAMPMGLNTHLNEGSSLISGGQAQRILIARAIVGRPKIIFFDEATSALDNVTQGRVMETLEKLDATRIVIAHRLSTIENCDRILVMEEGRIVEEGSFKELMEKKGKFYDLAVRQIADA